MIKKRKRGRPPLGPMPGLNPDGPENTARAVTQGRPKAERDFDKARGTRRAASRLD